MRFQILGNQSSYSPKIPVTHVPDTTDLSQQVGSRDSSYRPARIRVTDTDPVSLLEKVEDQAEIIDAETHERISIPLNVIYDDSTVSALEAAKEATQYGEGELTASHTYDLQPTDLETALRKLNGSIEVTGQEVLEYSLADNTLTEVLAGF